jgi:hypothetical protein
MPRLADRLAQIAEGVSELYGKALQSNIVSLGKWL